MDQMRDKQKKDSNVGSREFFVLQILLIHIRYRRDAKGVEAMCNA